MLTYFAPVKWAAAVAKGKDIRTSLVVMLSSLTEKGLKFIECCEPMML